MNESSNMRGEWVGLFVFIGLVILILGVLLVGNIRGTFTRKMEVVAILDDVNGLQSDNNVWFSGVKIGIVSEFQLYEKSQLTALVNINLKIQEYISERCQDKD